MPDHTDNMNFDKTDFDDQNVGRRSWSSLGQTCSRYLIVFLSQFFVLLLIFCGCFWCLRLVSLGRKSLGRNLVKCSRIHFTFTKVMNNFFFTKNLPPFLSLVGPTDSDKTYLIHEWLKVGTIQPKLDKFYFFYQHPQPVYDVMQKEIGNLEFVQGVHFEFINSSKKNSTKYLLNFDDSCAGICNPK